MRKVEIISVAQWGGLLVNNRSLPRKKAVGIVIHHTAGPNRTPHEGVQEEQICFNLARNIQAYHMGRRPGNGWRDSGHHFLVTRSGLVLEGRNGSLAAARDFGLVLQGAHCGNTVANGNRWGIEVEGTYRTEAVPERQWEALVDLCAQLSLWGNTQAKNLLGHRELKSTECPGSVLFTRLDELGAAARTRKLEMEGVR